MTSQTGGKNWRAEGRNISFKSTFSLPKHAHFIVFLWFLLPLFCFSKNNWQRGGEELCMSGSQH